MTTDAANLDLLLTHDAFVRALARGLVLDANDADDLAQQTWLAALTHPPTHASALRSWLATIVRNVASKTARATTRRDARERRVAHEERVPSTDEILEREAARRAVVEAVVALDEPYRSSVLLRYFEGLAPAAISDRLDVPVETVRTRLKRAHSLLRARLDGAHGGWARALAPLATASPAAAVAAPLVVALSAKKAIALGAAAVAALVGVIAYATHEAPRAPTSGAPPPVAAEARDGEHRRDVAAVDDSKERRADAAPADAHGVKPAKRAGVVREMATSRPIVGVKVSLAPPGAEPRELETDADGRFALDPATPLESALTFAHPVYFTRTERLHDLDDPRAIDVEVVLAPIGVMRVVVRDSAGNPIPKVPLDIRADDQKPNPRGWPTYSSEPGSSGTVTDAQGAFEAGGLPCGTRIIVRITPILGGLAGVLPGSAEGMIDPATRRATLTLVTETGARIRGRVVNRSGTGVAGVMVHLYPPRRTGMPFETDAVTRADGGYEFNESLPSGRADIVVERPEKPRASVEIGTSHVVVPPIVVEDTIRLTGRVISSAPIAANQVIVFAERRGESLVSEWVDARGLFAFDAPSDELLLRLLVSKHDEWQELREVSRRVVVPSADPVVFSLDETLARLRGRLGATNAGVATVSVTLLNPRPKTDARDIELRGYWRDRERRTIAGVPVVDGAFQCSALVPDTYDVVIETPNGRAMRRDDVVLRANETTDLGELELGVGRASGETVDASGRAVAGADVKLTSPTGGERRARSDAGGRFVFADLPCGAWVATANEGARLVAPKPVDVVIARDADARVRLTLHPFCAVEGRVLVAGLPFAGAQVRRMPPTRTRTDDETKTDADGRYRLAGFGAIECVIAVAAGETHAFDAVSLQPGETRRIDFDLDRREVTLRVTRRGQTLMNLEHLSVLCAGTPSVRSGHKNADGTFRVDLPKGPAVVSGYVEEFGKQVFCYAVVDGSGAEATLDVPLPEGAIELSLTNTKAHDKWPRLFIADVAGVSLRSIGEPFPLRVEVGADGIPRFHGVPEGATVVIRGENERGETVDKELVFRGPSMRVAW